jgi:amino acid adenylation domain-containing protein
MQRPRRLEELLVASARAHPTNVAIVDPDLSTITYRDLEEQASRISESLRRHGVVPGDRVGVYAIKSIGTVASLFGIMKAGAAYVPVDPGAPEGRNLQILSDCTVKTVVTDPSRAERLRTASGRDLKTLAVLDGLEPWKSELVIIEGPGGDTVETPEAELAYILYTSGSTGKPKGVMHTHASALSFVEWCSREFNPTTDDRFSSHAPFHFDLSILDLYVPIQHGAALVLIGEDLGKQPLNLARVIEEHRLTVWYSTPSILRLLVEYGKINQRDCSALRLVLFAGEVFPLKHLKALRALWPHPTYYNLYGPTETNVCTFYRVPDELPSNDSETLPIGGASSDDELRVVDPENREVPSGQEGELLVAGGSVMVGYWNRPERTAESFHVDAMGRRWYRTGDVVADQGNGMLRFLGRRDRMVKRRGYRVELGEIEAALYRHPSVTEAATIASSDAEGGVQIRAFLSWSGGKVPSLVELKQFCASNLPLYMVPDRFKVLEALPKTSTDKIDYRRLAELD